MSAGDDDRGLLGVYFSGQVVIAWWFHPIPFRTRSLNATVPMVLHLKVWESRTLPGLKST